MGILSLESGERYFVRFGVESWLMDHHENDSSSFFQIDGVILYVPEGSELEITCGRVRAYVMRASECSDASGFNIDMWEDNEELDDIARAVYRTDGMWTKEVALLWPDIENTDVFVIEEIFLDAPHRGSDLGLCVAERAITVFAGGCGIVAICPWPSEMIDHDDDDEARSSHARIGKHFERLGFQKIPRTNILARPARCPIRGAGN